jgi:hypothetical protein
VFTVDSGQAAGAEYPDAARSGVAGFWSGQGTEVEESETAFSGKE